MTEQHWGGAGFPHTLLLTADSLKGGKRQSRMDFALDTIEAMTFKDKIIEVCLGAEG